MTILNSHLLTQSPALLQLGCPLNESGLGLVQLGLEVTGLVAGVIQLNLSSVQLSFNLVVKRLGFLYLGLALLELNGELLLGGAHCGGDLLRDFQELASSLLQRLQLLATTQQMN